MTDKHEPYTTRSGRVLSDDDIEALAGEAERDPDLAPSRAGGGSAAARLLAGRGGLRSDSPPS